ncbi:MAG: hypothetical protein CL917_06040 [Deltaproteobacteria bacterium]|nr:hypothetical protein [Deltaproteobacteria bacterium]
MEPKIKSQQNRVSVSSATKGILGLFLLIAAIVLYRNLPLAIWMSNFNAYVSELGPLGPVLYALGFAASVALFLPVLPLSLGAGALFGLWIGFAVALVGATTGATISFLLARTLLRELVKKKIMKRSIFQALDKAISKSGGRVVFLTRLSPIIPFAIINLAYGLTGVRSKAYVLATCLGLIPTSLIFTFLGSTAVDVADPEQDMIRTGLQIAGAVATVIVAVLLTRFARKAILDAGIEESN